MYGVDPGQFRFLFNSPKQFPNLENLSLLIPSLISDPLGPPRTGLSVIGQYINGNYNLKKLSLDEGLWIINEEESLKVKFASLNWPHLTSIRDRFHQDLQYILMCDHRIEELKFVGHGCKPGCLRPVCGIPTCLNPEHLKPCVLRMPSMDADRKWIDRTIFRNEFPELVSYLRNRGQSRKRTADRTSEDEPNFLINILDRIRPRPLERFHPTFDNFVIPPKQRY